MSNIYGSNENGSYYKFPDGSLICTKRLSLPDIVIDTPWGVLYDSELLDLGNWAYPFVKTPIRGIIVTGSQSAQIELMNAGSGTEVGKIFLLRPLKTGAANYGVEIIGIGRWK